MLEKIRKIKEIARVFGEMRHLLPALNFKMPSHEEAISVGSAFEDAVAVEEAVVEHRYFGVRFFNQLSVEVDFHEGMLLG